MWEPASVGAVINLEDYGYSKWRGGGGGHERKWRRKGGGRETRAERPWRLCVVGYGLGCEMEMEMERKRLWRVGW